MDAAIEHGPARALDLAQIRSQLIRLEDTITFHLIERVQFALNKTIYQANGVELPEGISLLDWMLAGTERLHSLVRRYESPDEHPFFPEALQKPLLKPLNYPDILHPNTVNVNSMIKKSYIEKILPSVCKDLERKELGEMQENYGSAAVCDVACLQALSRRIHFGKFVAESKFRTETDKFVEMIKNADREGIDRAITNVAVEEQVLQRMKSKAITYGTDPSTPDQGKIDGEAVLAMYKEIVIPLTKIVEVEYLMQRLVGTKYDANTNGSNGEPTKVI